MPDQFIDSTLTTGDGLGGDWDNAYKAGTQVDWNSALSGADTVDDIIYVSNDNATILTSDITTVVNSVHTVDRPLRIIVATPTGTTTQTPVTDHGTAGNGEIDGNGLRDPEMPGNVWFWGLRIQNFDGYNIATVGAVVTFQRCFYGNIKSAGSEFAALQSKGVVNFIDTDLELKNNNNFIRFSGDACSFNMIGGSIKTDVNAEKIIECGGNASGKAMFSGVECSGVNSGTDIAQGGALESLVVEMDNCKFGTLPALFGSTLTNLTHESRVIVTQTQGLVSAQYRNGNLLQETTINRTGGADFDGSTPYCLKVESTSIATRTSPMRHLLAISNFGDVNGKTIKVHMASNTGTALQSDEIWIEVHVPTSSGVAQFSTVNTLTGTPSTYTDESGSEDWNDGGGDLTGYQEQSMSASPGVATIGLIYIWLYVAKDFTTTNNLFVDPKIDIA